MACKRFRTSKSVVTIMVIGLALATWGILWFASSTLAKGKPDGGGNKGNAKVCITLPAPGTGAGVYGDGLGDYCNNRKKKVEAYITQDGHLNLRPNTGGGTRAFYVNIPGDDGLEGWRLQVGAFRDDFDMRAMGIGVENKREDVNLWISTYHPNGTWRRIIFDPDASLWGIPGTGSVYATVTRNENDWLIECDGSAVVIIQDGNDFTPGGVHPVQPFTVTVRLQ